MKMCTVFVIFLKFLVINADEPRKKIFCQFDYDAVWERNNPNFNRTQHLAEAALKCTDFIVNIPFDFESLENYDFSEITLLKNHKLNILIGLGGGVHSRNNTNWITNNEVIFKNNKTLESLAMEIFNKINTMQLDGLFLTMPIADTNIDNQKYAQLTLNLLNAFNKSEFDRCKKSLSLAILYENKKIPYDFEAIAAEVDFINIASSSNPLDFQYYDSVLEKWPAKKLVIDIPNYSNTAKLDSKRIYYNNADAIPEQCFSSRHFLPYEKIGKYIREKNLAGVVLHDLYSDYPHQLCKWKYPQVNYIKSILHEPCHANLV